MKISLIYPLYREEQRLKNSLQDIAAFFQKFPLQTEVVLVMDPSHDQTHAFAEEKTNELLKKHPQIQFQILKNEKHLGRAKSLHKGLQAATGEILFCGSIDLNVPLAEYFNTLQDFVTNPQTEFIIGNRRDLKKPRHGQKNKISSLFETIQHEKLISAGFQVSDPSCQFVVMNRKAFEKIRDKFSKPGKWYYSAPLLAAANNHGVAISEKPIVCHDTEDTRFRWWMGIL